MSISLLSREDTPRDGGTLVTVTVKVGLEKHLINFWVSQGQVSPHNDFIVPYLLFPAMRLGLPMILSEVSPVLLLQLRKIQETCCTWWPEFFTKIQINATARKFSEKKKVKGTGLFFSSGVDSQYTLYKKRVEIDSLVFIQGLDTATTPFTEFNHKELDKAYLLIKKLADKVSKPLLDVRTDVRKFMDLFCDYGEHYHGSALCGIALLLSPQYGEFYIASSDPYVDPGPWGSHPLLDPLWSTEEVGIRQDGLESIRVEKVKEISKYKHALSHLYVCHKSKLADCPYNCCECVECMQTMLILYALGLTDKAITFNKDFDLKKFARIPIFDDEMKKNIEFTLELITDPSDRKFVEDAIKGRYYTWYWRLGRSVKQLLLRMNKMR